MSDKRSFASFEDFYPFYLSEHQNRTSRRLHAIGTTLALASVVLAIATWHWAWLIGAPLFGYGFAWAGHFLFEKNRPATFFRPFYSLRGDGRMLWEIASRKIPW